MPFVKISGLTTATAVSATNQFEINQNGASRSVTIGQVETFINPAKAGAIGASNLTMNTSRLLGRTTTSAGAIEEITVGSGLSLTGGSLSAALSTAGRLLNVQVFTSSGTYTRTTDATRAVVIAVGGGGGGGGGSSGAVGGNGGNGGTTSFGSHVTAAGGSGSVSGTNTPGAGGTGGTGALIAIRGQPGGRGVTTGSAGTGAAGFGGGQGGGTAGAYLTSGGAGVRGGGGGGAGGFTGGGDDIAYYACGGGGQGETAIAYITSGLGATETVTIGAGGSAGTSNVSSPGGAGGAGYVIVYEYA